MIIIFNISGAIVGLIGLVAGAFVVVATGSLTLGLLAVAGIWCALGRAKAVEGMGLPPSAPSIFFIPLFFWGLLVGVAAIPAMFVDFKVADKRLRQSRGEHVAADDDAERFKLDEAGLKTNESDDPELSSALVLLISEVLPGTPVTVRVKSSADSVLILMKLPDLKKIRPADRTKLLEAIGRVAEVHRPGVKVYAGVKGKLLYGAISTPDQPSEVGTSVPEERLFSFYHSAVKPTEPAAESPVAETPKTDATVQPAATDTTESSAIEAKPEPANSSNPDNPSP